MKPGILIVGAGSTGAHLARRLGDNWEVSVLDLSGPALESDLVAGCAGRFQGDGTSALVLRRAGASEMTAIVASTDSDEANLEILKLARSEFAVEHRYAVMQQSAWEARYEEAGAEVVNRYQACSALLESRIERRKVATNIGLGEGEIQEITVLPNSSVVGTRLADLHPKRWLVGAIYREGQLIVPHGDSVIAAGDRVVLIGDPRVLSSIATHIRSGAPEFPLHYGSSIVALGERVLGGSLAEIRYLLQATAARGLELIHHQGVQLPPDLPAQLEAEGTPLELVSMNGGRESAATLAEAAASRDAGLFVVEPRPLGFLSRVGLSRSSLVKLVDQLQAPVLLPRGTFPYRQVLLALAEIPCAHDAAQLAIDLVRMVGASLHLGLVHQPELVVGPELRREMEEERRQIEALARMYHVKLEVKVLEGNPVEGVLSLSEGFDLVVLPYRRRRRASLIRPDVGQNLMHRVRCSTLVMPI